MFTYKENSSLQRCFVVVDVFLGCKNVFLATNPTETSPQSTPNVIGPDQAVEFGAGTGHLGLLLAHLRPDISMVLVEVEI